MIGLQHYLVVSAALFSLGVLGVLTRRNAVNVLMGIELILNSANLNLVAFSRFGGGNLQGQMFAVFVIVIAAAEVAVALAIVLTLYRLRRTPNLDEADILAERLDDRDPRQPAPFPARARPDRRPHAARGPRGLHGDPRPQPGQLAGSPSPPSAWPWSSARRWSHGAPAPIFEGMLVLDPMGVFFKLLLIGASLLVVGAFRFAGSRELLGLGQGEFYALLLAVTFSNLLLAAANDLAMLYLALEMVSITSYVMVAYLKGDRMSNEASLKYILFGADLHRRRCSTACRSSTA